MRITYEFIGHEDNGDLLMHQYAGDMLSALCDLRRLVRDLKKGYNEASGDKLFEILDDIILNSKIDEIP